MQDNNSNYQQPAGTFTTPPSPPVPTRRSLWQWYRAKRKKTQLILGCGTLFAVMLLCSCIGSVAFPAAGQSNTTTTDAVPTATTAPTMIAQQTNVSTGPASTAQPTQKPTPTPKPTPKPTPDMYDANTA